MSKLVSSLTNGVAVANNCGAMEAETIFKNGRSSKSQTSRGNFLNYVVVAALAISAAFVASSCKKDKNDAKSFTVKFETDGGTAVADKTVAAGEKVVKPEDPTKSGHVFADWYREAALTTTWNFASDVVNADMTLYAKWSVNSFTVSFNTDGGSAVPSQTVASGGKVTEPADPAKEPDVAGLYAGAAPQYTFEGWFKTGETTPFNFASPITANVTLTAKWTAPPAPIDISAQTGDNIVTKAVNYAKANPGEYTLLIDADVAAGVHEMNVANVKLTIAGIVAERTITHNGAVDSRLFFLNATGASLTLGQNITLKGIPDGTSDLIYIANGSLTMLAGAKITGNTSNFYGAVIVYAATAVFNMEGGEISGNRTTADNSAASGGVHVERGVFNMSGGVITGNTSAFNTSSAADVAITQLANQFNLSGTAVINALILNAGSATEFAVIDITGSYSGKVENLHLRGNNANLNTDISWWVGKTIISGATADIVSKFTLGDFRNNGTDTQAISATHKLTGAGVLEANN